MRKALYNFRQKRGFTLVELAIVLAVTGVLFFGLYRLLSGGNQQSKDTATASQQIQLISAVKTFLASTSGQQWMFGINPAGSVNAQLPLPASNTDNANCKISMGANVNLKAFCDSLPIGFTQTTVNAYNQTFSIQVAIGPITAPATAPSTYSFMILTTNGDIISDADGGRISSQIGSDGGFIYSKASGACLPATGLEACGSYGSWNIDPVGTYGFVAGLGGVATGHVASRTYNSPESNGGLPWLARLFIDSSPATSTTSPPYNTMNTDLFLGGKNLWMGSNNDTTKPPAAGGPTIYLQGTTISDPSSLGNALQLFPYGASFKVGLNTINYLSKTSVPAGNTMLTVGSNCTAEQTLGYDAINNPSSTLHWAPGDTPATRVDCPFALVVQGDVGITGAILTGTYVYNSSDRRLKKDIQPLEHALDDVMKVQPVSFVLKSNNQKGLGFIAQDLEKIYPQLVMTHDRDGMKAVNYIGMIAPLVGAVQTLQAENDELRRELKEEAERQDRLEQALKK